MEANASIFLLTGSQILPKQQINGWDFKINDAIHYPVPLK
jgi:hypothetical protein